MSHFPKFQNNGRMEGWVLTSPQGNFEMIRKVGHKSGTSRKIKSPKHKMLTDTTES